MVILTDPILILINTSYANVDTTCTFSYPDAAWLFPAEAPGSTKRFHNILVRL